VCFHVTAGAVTTLVALDGSDGATGPITLTWPPKTDATPCPMVAPVISGPAQPSVGDQLSVAVGSFVDGVGSENLARSRCAEALFVRIPDTTSPTYTVRPQDVGTAIRVDDRVTNADGTARNTSAPTGVVSTTAATQADGRIFWVTKLQTGPSVFRIDSMLPDGSDFEPVTAAAQAPSFTTEPSVSSARSLVAFVDFGNGGHIEVMNPDGSGVRTSESRARIRPSRQLEDCIREPGRARQTCERCVSLSASAV
jgi:hypothetical protein